MEQSDIEINKRIMKGTGTRTFFITLPKEYGKVACKFTTIKKDSVIYTKPTDYIELFKDSVYIEMSILRLCTSSVLQNAIPNLPMVYYSFLCPKQSEYMLCTELANMDLEDWISKLPAGSLTEESWKALLAQVYATMIYLQNFGICHNDLHWGNVLVHNLGAPFVIHYRIDNIDYYVPSPNGLLFVVWDFELSYVLGKTRTNHITSTEIKYTYVLDYFRLAHGPKWAEEANYKAFSKPDLLVEEIQEYAYKLTPIRTVYQKLFKEYTKPNTEFEVMDTYDLDSLPKVISNEHIYLFGNGDIQLPESHVSIPFEELVKITVESGSNTIKFKTAIYEREQQVIQT